MPESRDTGPLEPGRRGVERTYHIPHCDRCPPLAEQPMRNLILGTCWRCGRPIDGRAAARMLRALRLIGRQR